MGNAEIAQWRGESLMKGCGEVPNTSRVHGEGFGLVGESG